MVTTARMLPITIIILLLIGMVVCDNVSSVLQIQTPSSLHKIGGYEHREALFGTPPYGKTLEHPLYYADDDLCDERVNKWKGYPVRPVDGTGRMEPWPSPFILMVDRGGCSFVQKVRNAQHAGASAVLIADNICLCSSTDCTTFFSTTDCATTEPIMADDGSGYDIDIPSFLIFKLDAEIVKEVMMTTITTEYNGEAQQESAGEVRVSMSWILPSPDGRVEYELWTVPNGYVGEDFEVDWRAVAMAFGERVYFTPRQYIVPGERLDCESLWNRDECDSSCTNTRRYCASPPGYYDGTSGADVVWESLRRICIWKIYGEDDGIGLEYWDYLEALAEECYGQDPFGEDHQQCVGDAMDQAGVDVSAVDVCMDESGGTEGDSENELLRQEIEAQERMGVTLLPTMFVNRVPLRGALTVHMLIGAICAGFQNGTQPEICDRCVDAVDRMNCVLLDYGYYSDEPSSEPFSYGYYNDEEEVEAVSHYYSDEEEVKAVSHNYTDEPSTTAFPSDGFSQLHVYSDEPLTTSFPSEAASQSSSPRSSSAPSPVLETKMRESVSGDGIGEEGVNVNEEDKDVDVNKPSVDSHVKAYNTVDDSGSGGGGGGSGFDHVSLFVGALAGGLIGTLGYMAYDRFGRQLLTGHGRLSTTEDDGEVTDGDVEFTNGTFTID